MTGQDDEGTKEFIERTRVPRTTPEQMRTGLEYKLDGDRCSHDDYKDCPNYHALKPGKTCQAVLPLGKVCGNEKPNKI